MSVSFKVVTATQKAQADQDNFSLGTNWADGETFTVLRHDYCQQEGKEDARSLPVLIVSELVNNVPTEKTLFVSMLLKRRVDINNHIITPQGTFNQFVANMPKVGNNVTVLQNIIKGCYTPLPGAAEVTFQPVVDPVTNETRYTVNGTPRKIVCKRKDVVTLTTDGRKVASSFPEFYFEDTMQH